MAVYRVASLAGLCFASIACGGGKGAGSTGQAATPTCSPCDDGGSATTTTTGGTNPDGVPYPSPPSGYGRSARSGSQPGSIMQNFKYLGYPNGDSSMGLQTIAMADSYDPCNKRYSLIHLTVAAVWCTPCNEETAAMVQGKSQLDAQRVLVLQALDDGPVQGTGATVANLNTWVNKYKPTFTEMLDPGLVNLGGFFNAAAVPWNCDIDPRTMEIINQGTGWAGDITTELATAVGLLGLDAAGNVQNPPAYPISATCNE